MTNAAASGPWRPDSDQPRPPLIPGEVYRPDVLAVIEETIDGLRPALRQLSDKIHGEYLTCLTFMHPSMTPHDSSAGTQV